MILNSFGANEAIFQIKMLVYNLFLMFKQVQLSKNEYFEQIKTFRLKYIFLAAKIVKTGRQTIMKIMIANWGVEKLKECTDFLFESLKVLESNPIKSQQNIINMDLRQLIFIY